QSRLTLFMGRCRESAWDATRLSPSSESRRSALAAPDTRYGELALKNGEGREARGWPERKAESREVRGAALEWRRAHARGTRVDGERQLLGSARPHRTALDARYPCLCEILRR